MIRVSTEYQSVEDQHREMVSFCNNEGYDELVFVEDKGASAIKLNDQYRLMIEQVKECISSDPDIKCFAVWELSRAFRNEGVYYEIKSYLLSHGVQFICKNPYLKLLNADGTLNSGMEIAMSLLATLAKQEMELKKERFKRAKDAMRKQGKFVGSRCVKYGYKVDGDGYVVIKEDDAVVARKVFELYSTGEYSVRTLHEELISRGIRMANGIELSYGKVLAMLSDTSYIGYAENRIYPPIISQELFDKCKVIREKNSLVIPKGRKYVFGANVFKCSICGRHMIAEGAQYRCWHHNKYSAPPHCENGLTIRVENMDGLLWWVAQKEEIKYRMKIDADKKSEYEGKISVLREKIAELERKIGLCDAKKKRIIDSYMDGLIDKKEREIRLFKADEEYKTYKESSLRFSEQIEALQGALQASDDVVDLSHLGEVVKNVIKEDDLRTMSEIVHKHIRRVVAKSEWFGKERDMRAVRQNAQLIEIETMMGEIKKYIYVARKYKGHYFWLYDESGKETPLLTVNKIVREKERSLEKRAFKKIKDW